MKILLNVEYLKKDNYEDEDSFKIHLITNTYNKYNIYLQHKSDKNK